MDQSLRPSRLGTYVRAILVGRANVEMSLSLHESLLDRFIAAPIHFCRPA